MSTESYIEDNTIILPVLKDGVTRIGDLWDCHDSRYVGYNLFKHDLDGEYVSASPIQNDEFKLIHCKSTYDKIKTIDVGGEMSVELLTGLITVKGSANYHYDEKEIENREQLICHSRKETFSIDALPLAESLLEDSVVLQILNNELKATHFVRRLTLGAEVKADILVTQNDKNSKTDIKGDFLGKIVYGQVNASVKASLGFLDSKDDKDFKKEINVHSIPSMKRNPTSVEEMFSLIEDINAVVDDQKYFPKKGDNVIGVPIKFVLVPINQFIKKINNEKLYLKLSDKCMNDFNEMLIKVHDIQIPGYIFKKVLEMNSLLSILLFDNESKLCLKIKSYEKDLREIGKKYFEESVKTLKLYKRKNAKIEDILGIMERFQEECNSSKVFEKAVELKEEGEGDLRSISYVDIESSKSFFHILTNENSLKQFIDGGKEIKIWLHTNDKVPDVVFLRLDEMIEPLSKLNIKVGIAVKSISETYQLCLKIGGKVTVYDDSKEIPYIINIIAATVGIGFDNEILFHSMNAEMLNMKLPFQNLDEMLDINHLIEKCEILKDVIITRSHSETFTILTRNDDKWKFFLPIDAKQTSFLAIRHLYDLASKFRDVDWIVGNLDNTKSLASGFLFLIKNSKVIAVCLDDFDLTLLRKKFINMSEDEISLLSPHNMNNSFYPTRAQSSEAVIKSIELHSYKNLNISEYGLKSFEEDRNEDLMNAIELACDLRSNKEINFISTIAKFTIQENKEMINILSEAGYSSTDYKFHNQMLSEKMKQSLIDSVRKILAVDNTLSLKIDTAIKFMNTVIETQEEDLQKYENEVSQVIDSITTDQNSTDDMKNDIAAYSSMELKLRCVRIKSVLEKYDNKLGNDKKLFNMKMLHSVLINDSKYHLNDILKKYIQKISLNDIIFVSAKNNFLEDLEKRHYNRLIFKMTECSFGVKYFILHKGLENYSGSNNQTSAIVNLLDKLIDNKLFNETHWQDIWKNNRFVYIIESFIDDSSILEKLLYMGCQNKVPDYIPGEIALKISKLHLGDEDFELPDIITNFDVFSEILREMRMRCLVPENFRTVLINSMERNKSLKEKLEKLKILQLFNWDFALKVFPHAIEIEIIGKAITMIDCMKKSNDSELTSQVPIDAQLLSMTFNHKSPIKESGIIRGEIIKIHEKYVKVYGNNISLIDHKKFVRLTTILEKPLMESNNLQQNLVTIIPYIIQKLKMWGCSVTTADNIYSLIAEEPNSNQCDPSLSISLNKPRFGNKKIRNSTLISKTEKKFKIPLSRLDIISGLINSMDAIVSQDILNIMAKFPVALPLIIRDLKDKDSYKNLIPWLTQPIIKWESTPGKIIENHLFVDKFKMIVALRIGKCSEGKSGKSTIINQIFSSKNMFSCCGEPGARRGKPVTLDGSVEFVWLTQETTSPRLWESVLQKHYESGMNEIILLANVHGNALDYEDHLKIFKTIASSYIFFIMSEDNDNLDDDWDKLEQILEIGEENKTFYVAIDPLPENRENYSEEVIIDTSKIADDSNIEKFRNVLKNCLINRNKKIDIKALQSIGSIKTSEFIETEESRELIEFIKKDSCKYFKRIMSLQRGSKTHAQCGDVFAENAKLRKVIELMGNVLSLKIELRLKAIIHIEKELNRIAVEESSPARRNLYNSLNQLQKTIGASGNDLVIVAQWKEAVKKALNEIDRINLGLEHFYREIGKLYEICLVHKPENSFYVNLAKSFAELFSEGQAIELLDGDSGKILGPWLTVIFDNVHQKFPGLRIFVISILGLQSSGKSTLLNALFACKFAVSVGRCTRGLFMRLLFLDEEIKTKLNFDAILLIDTEGLGAPERQNEPDAEKKDRIMATFAIGISHLTIVNVLGEYMRDLTEILQIAIVAMARLEEVDISPDILMVQHLTERNSDKMTNASKQFGDALEKAINLAEEKDVDLGIRDSKCLNTLRHTISTGNLFHQFRPFKNGASVYSPPSDEYHQDIVELQKSIIDIADKSQYKTDLKTWQILTQSYWDNIKEENFMRFKDIKDLQEYLRRGEMMAKVKESIESAFRYHSENLKNFIIEQAKKLNKQEITRKYFLETLKAKLKFIPSSCTSNTTCNKCEECIKMQSKLYNYVTKTTSEHETRLTVHKFIEKIRNWHFNQLYQIMSAIAFRQVESADTLDKIEKRLNELRRDKTDFSESEIKITTDNIWHDIEKEAADRVMQVSVSDQITSEIRTIYQERPEFIRNIERNIDHNLRTESAIEKYFWKFRKGISRYTGETNLLELYQVDYLERKLTELSGILLKGHNAQSYQTGMVAKLKRTVEKIIKDFEETFNLKLKSEFKWTLHSHANQLFKQKMLKKQQKWDEDNNPLTILHKNKSQYIQVITERLRHGVSYDSEGLIAGKQLLTAISLNVLKEVNEEMVRDILSIDWLSNSESVRLKYFSELVEQVKNDDFQQALDHFNYPKCQIMDWFERKIDDSFQSIKFEKFNVALKLELNRVKQEIKSSSNIMEIRNYVKKYLSSSDGIDSDLIDLNLSIANTTETDIFTNRILEALDSGESVSDITSNTIFSTPSRNKQIMKRMGCNYFCPLCFAPCWGQCGHHEDEGESSKHYTCHQPIGLSAIGEYESKKLICYPCHIQKDDWIWQNETGNISWSEMKISDRCKNWKFETHVTNKFNDMMKWFFFILNEYIAEAHNMKPPETQDLKKYGISEVDIDTVIAVINSRIKQENTQISMPQSLITSRRLYKSLI